VWFAVPAKVALLIVTLDKPRFSSNVYPDGKVYRPAAPFCRNMRFHRIFLSIVVVGTVDSGIDPRRNGSVCTVDGQERDETFAIR
jgi:hypothetical protein